jgi:hypothetical protein
VGALLVHVFDRRDDLHEQRAHKGFAQRAW